MNIIMPHNKILTAICRFSHTTYVVYAILKITVLNSSVIFFVNYFKINVYKTCLCKISVYICRNELQIKLKSYENN